MNVCTYAAIEALVHIVSDVYEVERASHDQALVPPGGGFDIPYKRILNGGTSYEYFEPVVAGDVITSVSRITEFQERQGSIGSMLITYRETEFKRQDGTTVAKMYGNLIQY